MPTNDDQLCQPELWRLVSMTLTTAFGTVGAIWGVWLLTFAEFSVGNSIVLLRDGKTTWGAMAVLLGVWQAATMKAAAGSRLLAACFGALWWSFVLTCVIRGNWHAPGVAFYAAMVIANLTIVGIKKRDFFAFVAEQFKV